jgi:hypothetical protein
MDGLALRNKLHELFRAGEHTQRHAAAGCLGERREIRRDAVVPLSVVQAEPEW